MKPIEKASITQTQMKLKLKLRNSKISSGHKAYVFDCMQYPKFQRLMESLGNLVVENCKIIMMCLL